MSGVRGAILAGGGATRFGGKPKGLERVGGERILDRLTGAMQLALGSAPLLVANAPEAGGWQPALRVVADRRPGLGALGGIYTAVLEAPAPVVCVAWDMPFVSASLIRRLADAHAAVLVVELAGRVFDAMPEAVIEEAEAVGLPLVGLADEIPFVETSARHDEAVGLTEEISQQQEQTNQASQPDVRPEPIRNKGTRVGRNDPCPCGSGKKYKNCHMRQSGAA